MKKTFLQMVASYDENLNKIIYNLKVILCCPDADKTFNYRKDGNVDSLNLIRFILSVEKLYSITFTQAEIESDEFNTIGSLAHIIQGKLK